MNKYWENKIRLLKDVPTAELVKRIVSVKDFIAEYPLPNSGYLNYLAHLKCEYAERVGK